MLRNLLFILALSAAEVLSAQTPTLVFNDASVTMANPPLIGINMAADDNYQSGIINKELLSQQNPGFEALQLRQNYTQGGSAGSNHTFNVPDIYAPVPANRFTSATYLIAESPNGNKGCAGAIGSSTATVVGTSGPAYTLGTPCAATINAEDNALITLKEFPTAQSTWEETGPCSSNPCNQIQGHVTGGATLTSETGSGVCGVYPDGGAQSLTVNTTPAGSYAFVQFAVGTSSENNFVVLHGTFHASLAVCLKSGSGPVGISINGAGGYSCSGTVAPGAIGSWVVGGFDCTGTQTATSGFGGFSFAISPQGNESVTIDHASFKKTSGQDTTNTTVFRDEIVHAYQALCGNGVSTQKCPIRDHLNQYGETWPNWVASSVYSANQQRAGTGATYNGSPTPRLQEFLALVEKLNGVAWVTIPPTFTEAEGASAIEFLADPSTTSTEGARRTALGHPLPYVGPTGTLGGKINLEFCNECWNPGFAAASYPYDAGAYIIRTTSVFGAMRGAAHYNPAYFTLIANLQLPGTASATATDFAAKYAAQSSKNGAPDALDMAPYSMDQASDFDTDADLFTPALEEAYGNAYDPASSSAFPQAVAAFRGQNFCGSGGASGCDSLVYEFNANTFTTCSSGCSAPHNQPITQAAMDALTGGPVQALAQPYQALNAMRKFQIRYQHIFGLNEYTSGGPNGVELRGFGLLVDAGGAASAMDGADYRFRASGLGIMLANMGIIGSMTACSMTSQPTYNYAGSLYNGSKVANAATSPSHALNGVPLLDAFCFMDGAGNRSMLVYNLDLVNGYTLGLSGTNPPTGTVAVTQFAPSTMHLLNEPAIGATAPVAATMTLASSTLSNPATLAIPPYSAELYRWSTTLGAPTASPFIVGTSQLGGASVF